MDYLIGIDIGMTELKTILFDKNGNIVSNSSNELRVITKGDFIECDFVEYFNVLLKVLKEVVDISKVKPRNIKGISISSQAETFVLTDDNYTPLDLGISYVDNRATGQAQSINSYFGTEFLYKNTGLPEIFPGYPAPKILWIKENRRDIFNKIAHIFLIEDYMGYKLTGNSTISGSIANTTGMFNNVKYEWQKDILKFVGIKEEMLSSLDYCENVRGSISANIAKVTGLSPDTIISTGGMDQMFCAVGAGNTKPGVVSETTGTAMAIVATLEDMIYDPDMQLQCLCHAIKGKYVFMPYTNTAAVCLRWFRDEFCEKEIELSEKNDKNVFDILTEKAASILPGSNGLIFLPHLQGATFPEKNLGAKGIFFGFSLGTKKANFIRAILEGVSYSLKNLIKMLDDIGLTISEIRSIGGASKSNLWNQIKADIAGKNIKTMKIGEAGCLGAAIFGGVASGVFSSVEEAVNNLIREDRTYVPNTENKNVYEEEFKKYNLLYKNIENLF